MQLAFFRLLLLLAAALAASGTQAAVISYQATQINGTTWRNDYTVLNDGPTSSRIRLFDILFDPALYKEVSLTIVSAPAIASDWDEMILASGVGVPAAYDVLAKGGGIGGGESVSGFAVRFVWLGTGTPASPRFEIYDPITFGLISSGTTSPVPAPVALSLLATGLVAVGLRAGRRKSV